MNSPSKNAQSIVVSAGRGQTNRPWLDSDVDFWLGKTISEKLHRELHAWHDEFLAALIDPATECAILDWECFHAKGVALARCLKIEIGSAAHVYYVKPIEDPNKYLQGRLEIFDDGSVVPANFNLPDSLINTPWLPRQIVSGGQTGADRAALDFACLNRIPHGGWCPRGRLAVDGALSFKYQLRETESAGYRQRTKRNIQDSDATVIFNSGDLDGGTLQTQVLAEKMRKPHRLFQLDAQELELTALNLVSWLEQGKFSILNVAGPREEKRPGIYQQVMQLLEVSLKIDGNSLAVLTDAKA